MKPENAAILTPPDPTPETDHQNQPGGEPGLRDPEKFYGVFRTRDGSTAICSGFFAHVEATGTNFVYDRHGNVTYTERIDTEATTITKVPASAYGNHPLDLVKRISAMLPRDKVPPFPRVPYSRGIS